MSKEEELICTYCGADAECREHVIPVVYFGKKRRYTTQDTWIVPACNSCNSIAGTNVFFSIPEKAKFILKKFKSKHRKVLNMPAWKQDELDELDYKLKTMIFSSIVAKRVATDRAEYLKSVSEMEDEYQMPDFIKTEYKIWLDDYRETIKKLKQKKRNEKKHYKIQNRSN